MKFNKSEANVLFIDIENIAELGWVWDMYEATVLEVERPGHLLTVGYKWQGEKKTHVIGQDDFKGYKPKSGDDKKLCQFVWDLIDKADVVIGHNAKSFDMKKLNYRFMVNGLTPPSPTKVIDTLTSMRAVAKAPSNKLNSLGKVMNIGQKVEHEGWSLWKKCYLGDPKAWKKMKQYNKQDVDLLEKWYMILRPWISNHPNFNVYNKTSFKCPHCGSSHTNKRGYAYTKTMTYQQYQCKNCFAWSRGESIKRDKKEKVVLRS